MSCVQQRHAANGLLFPSITIIEVFRTVLRQRSEELALEAIAHIKQGPVIDLNSELASSAGIYGIELKLPLADHIIDASAKKYDAIVWTQDVDFKGPQNVKYYPQAEAT